MQEEELFIEIPGGYILLCDCDTVIDLVVEIPRSAERKKSIALYSLLGAIWVLC